MMYYNTVEDLEKICEDLKISKDEAMERIAKGYAITPIIHNTWNRGKLYSCPRCGNYLLPVTRYCPDCGQHINWSKIDLED